VVADGMTGGAIAPTANWSRRASPTAASALFGGLPATGAIARTATNIRAGARSPVAGILHACFLLAFMLLRRRWRATSRWPRWPPCCWSSPGT
jgi:SulP family sulfate permease